MVLKENYKKLLKEVSNKFVNLQVNPYGEVEIDLSKYGENQEELIKVLEKWRYTISKRIDDNVVAINFRDRLDSFKLYVIEFKQYIQEQIKDQEELVIENINWEYMFNSFEIISIVESMGLQCKIEKSYRNIYYAIITRKKNEEDNIENNDYFDFDFYGKILLYDHYANTGGQDKIFSFSYYDYELTHGIDFEEFDLSSDANSLLKNLIGAQYAYKVPFLVCVEPPSKYLREIRDDWDFIITTADNFDHIKEIAEWAEENNKIFFTSRNLYREPLSHYRNTLELPVSTQRIAGFLVERLALDLSISFKHRNWENIRVISQYFRMSNGELLYDALKRNIAKSRFGYVGVL